MLTVSWILARLSERGAIVLMRMVVAVSSEYDDNMDSAWWSPVSNCGLLVHFSLGRGPRKNCKNDLDDQT